MVFAVFVQTCPEDLEQIYLLFLHSQQSLDDKHRYISISNIFFNCTQESAKGKSFDLQSPKIRDLFSKQLEKNGTVLL